MKSAELYRLLRGALGPWFKAAGFKSAGRAQLGWYRMRGDRAHLAWAQCNQWGWDVYAGSSFFLNFQVGPEPVPWSGRTERLQAFLADDELEEARSLQNRIISELPAPPASHVSMLREAFSKASPNAGDLMEAYLGDFRPVESPFRRNHDFAMKYHKPEDVLAWARFILQRLPRIQESVVSWPESGGAELQSLGPTTRQS